MTILFWATAEETATTEIAIAVRTRVIQDIVRLPSLCRLRDGLSDHPAATAAPAPSRPIIFVALFTLPRLRMGHRIGSKQDSGRGLRSCNMECRRCPLWVISGRPLQRQKPSDVR